MRNALGKLVRLFLLIILAPLICSCTTETLLYLSTNLDLGLLGFFFVGFVFYALLYGAILYTGGQLYSHLLFLRTLRHELTHSVAGMFFGRQVDEMLVVNPAGRAGTVSSHVTYLNTSGLDSLITLAPYYVPLFTIPLLPLRFFVDSWPRALIDFLIGFTLAFHYAALIDELLMQRLGLRQPDIANTGMAFSYVIIIVMNLIFLAIIKAVIDQQWPSADHLTRFFTRSWESYLLILRQLRNLLVGG
jgi:hypothetical protein